MAFAAGLLVQPILAQAQTGYDYQMIDYPGGDFTQVWGINARGDVVGNSGIDGVCLPFVYDSKEGTFTDVAPVAGFDCTSVLGISDSGILAGSVSTNEPFLRSGLILDKKGNAIVFDHPDAVTQTSPRDINNDGFVTGIVDVDEEDEFLRGFIYDSLTGTFTDIVPSVQTIAQGINADGYVVGSARFFGGGFGPPDPCGDDGIGRYGWLRAPDGTVTFFDVNGWTTSARDITDSGTIAGWVFDPDAATFKSIVTELDGTQCQSIAIPDSELLIIPGALSTVAQGIKNSGTVVGNDVDAIRGFIATPQ
jgi:uncharacterized membrane protein